MKKIVLACFFLLFVHYSIGQKNIDGLIQAEKNFAAYSVANSTKEAFLKFLDSAGLVFERGKAVNGIQTWSAREKAKAVLDWQPQFAEIAMSNDLGYTTGPWTFKASANDSVAARGQYTTVWHMDKNGEWKFLVDLGVGNTPVNSPGETIKIHAVKQSAIAENDFIKAFSENKSTAYAKYLSKESILTRHKYAPATTAATRQIIIDSTSSAIQYTVGGMGVSADEDIFYVYGTAILKDKTENYLRIWRHEKDGWKIAVEVLRL
jgi:ketosteroid isomerase-like protein